MKKIFTLLFCVAALSASAANPIDECVTLLLGHTAPTTLMAANLDANDDGTVTVEDIATIIEQQLQTPALAPNVNVMVQDAINGNPPKHNVEDVNSAVEQNLQENK